MANDKNPNVTLQLIPERRPIGLDCTEFRCLCRIMNDASPDEEGQQPVRIGVAFDRSGSMTGSKLQSSAATLVALLEQLGPQDMFCLVAFDERIDVLAPPTHVTPANRHRLQSIARHLGAEGGTDLCGGVLRLIDVAESARAAEPWHLIVLTDGAPTAGVTLDREIVRLVGGGLGRHSLTCFGFGSDVRPELLGSMADTGRGQYHFVATVEAPVEAFASELGRQRATIGADVRLVLRPGHGVTIRSWPSFVKARGVEKGGVEMDLPVLTAGDPMAVVVRLVLAKEAFSMSNPTAWLEAKLQFREMVRGAKTELKASFVPVVADKNGPLLAEVAREVAVQDAAELLLVLPALTPAEGLSRLQAIEQMTTKAGVNTDPQVSEALAMVRRLLEQLSDVARAREARVQTQAFSRGLYQREVTSIPGSAYSKHRTMTGVSKMQEHIDGESGKGSGKDPGGKKN